MTNPQARGEMREVIARTAREAFEVALKETGPCARCEGKGYHHGFGEDGCDPDWCVVCGGAGFDGPTDDEAWLKAADAILAALSTQPLGGEEKTSRSQMGGETEAADYEALGRACERHGLAGFGDDGEMLFRPPDEVIAAQATAPLWEQIARLKAERDDAIAAMSRMCGDA